MIFIVCDLTSARNNKRSETTLLCFIYRESRVYKQLHDASVLSFCGYMQGITLGYFMSVKDINSFLG